MFARASSSIPAFALVAGYQGVGATRVIFLHNLPPPWLFFHAALGLSISPANKLAQAYFENSFSSLFLSSRSGSIDHRFADLCRNMVHDYPFIYQQGARPGYRAKRFHLYQFLAPLGEILNRKTAKYDVISLVCLHASLNFHFRLKPPSDTQAWYAPRVWLGAWRAWCGR